MRALELIFSDNRGVYITGFRYGPSQIIRRFWDGWTWCYECENGAVFDENEISDIVRGES